MDPAAVSSGAKTRPGISARHPSCSVALSAAADCSRPGARLVVAQDQFVEQVETGSRGRPGLPGQLDSGAMALREFSNDTGRPQLVFWDELFRLLRPGKFSLRPL